MHAIDFAFVAESLLDQPFSFIYGVIVNPYTNCVYVEFGGVVLDGTTLENVTSGYEGHIEAVDPIHNVLYTSGYDKLYVLDGNTHQIGGKLYAEYLVNVAVNSKTGRAYLTHRDLLEHETIRKISVVQGPLSPFRAAKFVVSDLNLEQQEVETEEYTEVTVKIMNVGDLEDAYIVELSVAGLVKAQQSVMLLGGESEIVTFMFYEEEPGTYEIEIDGQKSTITVHAPPSYGPYGVIVAVIIGAIMIIAFVAFVVRRVQKATA